MAKEPEKPWFSELFPESRTQGSLFSEEDRALWAQWHQQVTPLPETQKSKKNLSRFSSSLQLPRPFLSSLPLSSFLWIHPKKDSPKGIFLQGKLDLHGLTLQEAYEAMSLFLSLAHEQNKKWVLLITGKGPPHAEDSLKKQLPRWLSLRTDIRKYQQALPRHGGEGALYVQLKYSRESPKRLS